MTVPPGTSFIPPFLLLALLFLQGEPSWADQDSSPQPNSERHSQIREQRKRSIQDSLSGIPRSILDRQSSEKVIMPSIDSAVQIALAEANKMARAMIDTSFHKTGKSIPVPNDYPTIQAAINAAQSGDQVVVEPGIYYELLVMKNGVKLVSDSATGGEELMAVQGARLKLPQRALRTVIDGSKAQPSEHGMIDFNPGTGRKTIIDGFTFQNLPAQDHHIPGHAHGLNVRGAAPVIMNCLIRNMGSTGIGSHVVYHDQSAPMPERDFRTENVKHPSSAVIYNNIIHGSLGLGIGSNHLAEPYILGNEIFANSDEKLGGPPSPGIGNKHGSAAIIIGNIVHDNPGGGILCSSGAPQGKYPINRRTHPQMKHNVVYNSGPIRSGISCSDSGSVEMPVQFIKNFVYGSQMSGIGFRNNAVGIIEGNMVANSRLSGISVNNSTVLRLNRNRVTGTQQGAGITIVNEAVIKEMIGNASDSNNGLRFMVNNGKVF